MATVSVVDEIHGEDRDAILEHRGASIAMMVTEGNRDILEIARLQKHDQFNLLAAEPAGIALPSLEAPTGSLDTSAGAPELSIKIDLPTSSSDDGKAA